MSDGRSRDGSRALMRARREFGRWRRGRRGRQRIPQGLWDLAVEAAAEHGIHQVSRVLGLNHSALKAAVQKRTDKVVGDAAAAGFVELAWPAAGGSGACMIEAEDGRGTMLRIYPNFRSLLSKKIFSSTQPSVSSWGRWLLWQYAM